VEGTVGKSETLGDHDPRVPEVLIPRGFLPPHSPLQGVQPIAVRPHSSGIGCREGGERQLGLHQLPVVNHGMQWNEVHDRIQII